MSNHMTKEDAARIQSANAKAGNGFAQRAQAAADKRQHEASQSQSGGQSGGQQSGQGGTQSGTRRPKQYWQIGDRDRVTVDRR